MIIALAAQNNVYSRLVIFGACILSLVFMGSSSSRAADEKSVASSSGSFEEFMLRNPIADAASKVKASVVNISASKSTEYDQKTLENYFGPYGENFFKRFFEIPEHGERTQTLGSGFIFDKKKGYILTANHVIEEAENITITIEDGHTFNAEIIGTDPKTDIAVLKVSPGELNLSEAKFGDSNKIRVGDWAIAIGNPFRNLAGTVTFGVISATGRSNLYFGSDSPQIQDYIQTDASINPGNSGGPLVDINGSVIGINGAITTPSGGNVGIGFAIPVNLVKEVLDDLIKFGKVKRAFLGVTIQAMDPDIAESMGLKNLEGVLINGILENSPAEDAGLEKGDVILEFNKIKVTTVPGLQRMVGSAEIGKEMEVSVLREGKRRNFYLTLKEMDDIETSSSVKTENLYEWLGLTVAEPSSEDAKNLNIQRETGVVVVKVKPGSSSDRAGLLSGMVILEIDSKEIKNIKDYREAAEKNKSRQTPILFLLEYNDSNFYRAIKPEKE